MSEQLVIETPDGWMIRCAAHGANASGHHVFPKKRLSNGAAWTFNGDLAKPTFTPSMNEGLNLPGPHHNPAAKSSRCHFIVRDGRISYCDDCTHDLRGEHAMLPWDENTVRCYVVLMEAHRRKEAHGAVSR